MKFLNHCATFRLHVGQLIIQEVGYSTDTGTRSIDSCCVTCSLVCKQEERYCCITVIRWCRCTAHSRL